MQQEDVCGIIVTFYFGAFLENREALKMIIIKRGLLRCSLCCVGAMRRPRIAEWAADAVPTLSFYRVMWKYYQ